MRFENKMYEESKVMEICVSMLDKVVDNYKNNVYPWHYKYIIKDCILWSQHILYLLTVPSVDIAGKSPEETLEIRKRDYTVIPYLILDLLSKLCRNRFRKREITQNYSNLPK